MKKIIFVNFSVIAGILSMMLLVSCGGGGSSTSSGGGTVSGATVQGNVSQFNGVAMTTPGKDHSILARALGSVSDTVLSTANALAGVTVTIAGLDTFTATTDSDGEFYVEGVPPGSYTLNLIYGGATASIPIVIPANAEEVYLDGLRVDGNNIAYNDIRIEIDDGRSSDNSVASDDVSSDDNSSDDVSSVDDPSSDDDSSAATAT